MSAKLDSSKPNTKTPVWTGVALVTRLATDVWRQTLRLVNDDSDGSNHNSTNNNSPNQY